MRRGRTALERFMRVPRLSRSAQNRDPVRDLALNYFAGEDVDDAVVVGRDLAGKGLLLSFAYLAHDDEDEATQAQLVRLLGALAPLTGVELSIRPSTLGLRESLDRAVGRLDDLCAAASEWDGLVTLEMQGPAHYVETLELFRRVRERRPCLGVTLPVEFRRAESDARSLGDSAARVRAVIGAFAAPRRFAFRREQDKSLAMVRCLRALFESRGRPLVASHDPRIVEIAQELARRNQRPPSGYEFQMMMGVRPLEQRRLVDVGLACRTYIPFGPAWYDYLSIRVAARPRMLLNYGRAVLDKR